MNNPQNMQQEVRPLIEYWHTIRRHKWAIISITALCTIIGLFIASSKVPIYQATSRLLIVPETQQLLFSDNAIQGTQQLHSFYRTQIEIINSRSLAADIINKLGLSRSLDYLPAKPGFLTSLISFDETGQSSKHEKKSLLSEDALIAIFKSHLSANSDINSEVVGIRYEGKDPGMTAKIVNMVADEYIKRVELSQHDRQQENVGWLSENLEIARKKLVESEAELQSYQSRENIGDSKDEDSIQSGKYGNITSKLLSARTKRAEYEIRLRQVHKLPRTIDAYQNVQYVLKNSRVQNLKEKLNLAIREMEILSQRYGRKHPKIILAKNSLKSARKSVNAEIFRVIDSIEKDYELAVAQEKEVANIYEQMQVEDRSQKGNRFDVAKLEREVETNKELYNMLLTKLKEADLSRNKGKINIKIIDRAQTPGAPFKPNKKRIITIAFLLGLIGSILLSFLREFNNKTFKTGDNVAEVTKTPLLGIFPLISKKDLERSMPERLIVDKPRSTVAEAVNNIRTNLMFGDGETSPRVIMVTSAVASEGKTTVSTNIGISLAHLGPTLIIEADTRRPRMKGFLKNTPKDGGVFEYIAGKSTLRNSVVRDPDVRNLYTMPVKMKPAKPIEFLSSKRFSDALILLRKKFKFIVIDTPPVLPVSDAIVLSALVDGVIVVVGAESTKHGMTLDALHRLRHVNAPVLGMVLSRANPKTYQSYGYGGYGGYGYGGYGGYGYGQYGNTAY